MSANKLKVSVISPEKILYKGEVDSLIVPGSEGFFGILPDHAPLVATLGIGILEIRKGEKLKVLSVEGGFVEIKDNSISILTDHGALKEDIDLEVEKKNLAEAEKLPPSDSKNLFLQKTKTRILIASR
ncbi:ATP synthase F1, epsilon subunit [Leptospira interrogans str. 2003000735]|uniref:ATP synthase epsilon chain n=2 Tax=Leptospira interrogans TaxID=173 RepID=A0A829DAB3_LEPIR|nr:ATP synthase F1 subunit epsilon [Leptospira interrogans]EMY05156.1 ATP synthase F1, epsilon subunit [Leptospira interrogans str. 2002000626]EMY23126.1 ATP synthase F1, epsilon subunit [Leptospira interrogans serovar Australis str. 200703203]EKN86599.1 ATP synthase F1, epsilon subunit [Leptospira interrogans str. 2002000624]EKQ39399.1 ATP synthase F1, epsilon subunit [Leptospira interrogans str. 2002000621]EKQ47391.1 ATP synthase F1, epsilon subunit [Leptospira interrogans str. 2002000623]